MPYRRGDIVLVRFPYADLYQVKNRPALVVQADNLQTGLQHLILAMITSNLARAGFTCRVLVSSQDVNFPQTSLRDDSVIMADHLATLDQQLIAMKIGVMPDMSAVETALRVTFSL